MVNGNEYRFTFNLYYLYHFFTDFVPIQTCIGKEL